MSENEKPGAGREKANILLVDDQPARLLSYEAILRELGENLVLASSGIEALERLMKDDFAVILLDVSMPGMDGFETASLIHEHPRFEKTPIIFVTGLHFTDLDRLKGYELGAVDYVYVPVVPQILRSKVAVLVELYTKRRELQKLNRSLEEANAELAETNSTLQAEKTRELQRLNDVLASANRDLGEANRTLQSEVVVRERLEQALREADRRKDEFLAVLSHELRNPLAPILNAVHILRTKTGGDPEIEWSRDVIERQAGNLTRLVDDLLDVSRITQGKINLRMEPVDLSTIVARAVETMRPLIDARQHELVLDLPAEPLRVLGDATRLAQAVGNLLSNAAKYTETGGRIRLAIERSPPQEGRDESVVIRVSDTGAGIPPAMLPRVFDLFTQADRTRDRAEGGLGIGLAVVQRLVELHSGTVSALSDGEGKGSEFIVQLPLLDGVFTAPAKPVEAPRIQAPLRRRRILVADDNVDAAQALAILLTNAGSEVEVAHDGAEAVEVAKRFRPEVALLDIGMPKLDGYGAARGIREQPWGHEVVLIALTGWGQKEVRDRTQEAGFDAHLVKPADFAAIARLLTELPVGARCRAG
jgi:signal transduction histidine kinase